MLGIPLVSWVRFFGCGFVAGTLLCFVPIPPIAAIGVFEMLAAIAGLILVAVYARSYRRRAWCGVLVRGRRLRRAVLALTRHLQLWLAPSNLGPHGNEPQPRFRLP